MASKRSDSKRKPRAKQKAMVTKGARGATTKRPKRTSDGRKQKPKRLSALDAAAEILKKTDQPMNCREMITAMAEQALWSSPKGVTPHATLYAAILREARNKGDASRFKKIERGKFVYAGKDSR